MDCTHAGSTGRSGVAARRRSAEPRVSPPYQLRDRGMPYVYTRWEQYTIKDGLPNDHIFALAVDGERVWIGTEGGLACLYKQSRTVQAWQEKDGLPWRVVTGLAIDPRTHDVWIALFGRPGPPQRRAFRALDQLNSGLVNNVVYVCASRVTTSGPRPRPALVGTNTVTGE